jgi:dTDP-4-amino-4,6-dideoxygalactose transaminase
MVTNRTNLATKTDRIYLSPPDLSGSESRVIVEALKSKWVSTVGPEVDQFEGAIRQKMGVGFALALSSGTAALHLALLHLGIKPGDVVIASSLTFAATVNPIAYCGATPVLIDSDDATWNMDPALLEEALAESAKTGQTVQAVIPVDLYGQGANYAEIAPICEKYGVPMIEDAAEAIGATVHGKPCGAFGKAAILSFNGNKIITTSGGGMLVSNDEELIKRARHLATQARDPFPYYHHTSIGYNYRLSNLLAAIGRAQLQSLDEKVARRRAIFQMYFDALHELPGVSFMPEASYGRSTRWLTCLTIDPDHLGVSNEDIRLFLEEQNIESRPVWKPMHLQPVFQGCRMYGGAVSERLFRTGLCLPSGSGMSDDDVNRVIEAFLACVKSGQ